MFPYFQYATNHFVRTNATQRSLNSVKLIRRNVPVDVVGLNKI